MKTIKLLLCLLCGLSLSSCVYEMDPGYPQRPGHPGGGHDRSNFYQEGYDKGESDARRGRSQNASRHFDSVPRSYHNEFSRGYDRGYDSRRPGDGGSGNYYQAGSNAGQRDKMRGLSYQPQRHYDSIPRDSRDSFDRGYDAGWGSTSNRPSPGFGFPPQLRY